MRTSLPLLLALAACGGATENKQGSSDDTAPIGGEDSADTAAPDTSACTPHDIEVEVTPITTVLRVRWTTDVETSGVVEFSTAEGVNLATPATVFGTTHEALVLGVTADTDVELRVRADRKDCSATSEAQTARTGSLPSGLYPMRATGTAPWSGYEVLPVQGSSYAIVIIDNQGRYVWYYQPESSGNLMRAFLSADGQSVVICQAGPQESLQDGKILKVALDGSSVAEYPFPYIDHDMVELPDGTIAAIVVDPREGGTADSIVELSPDGTTTTEVFNAWDNWDPVALGVPENEPNWTHGNGLDYDPVEDVYYLSMKTLRSLAKIDRATGEVLWTMNGLLDEFTHADGPLEMHHQFEVLDGTILFFENGEPDRAASRAVEIAYDDVAMTTEEIWSYQTDPPLYVYAKGDVHRFPDDVTEVVWSSAGQIQDVTASGELLWQLDLELGQAVTFTQYVPSMYASTW